MIYEGSSTRTQVLDPSGRHVIKCWSCGRHITLTTLPMTRALCWICEAAEAGTILTEAAIRAYELSRLEHLNRIGLLSLDPEPVKLPGKKKFSLAALGEGLNQAIGFMRRKPEEQASASRRAAAEKRTGRLLENLQEGDLTDMESVDRAFRDADK